MVQVVVVVVGGGGGEFCTPPRRPCISGTGTNNLGRFQNSKNPDPKKFLPVTNPLQENHPIKFKLQI